MALGFDEDWFRDGLNARRLKEEILEARQAQERMNDMMRERMNEERLKMMWEMEEMKRQVQMEQMRQAPRPELFSQDEVEGMIRALKEAKASKNKTKKEQEHFSGEDFEI